MCASSSDSFTFDIRDLDPEELVPLVTPIVHYRVVCVLRSFYSRQPWERLEREAEDLVQEIVVFLVVLGGFDGWDPERGLTWQSFVDMVARRRTWDRILCRRLTDDSEPDLEEPYLGPDPERQVLMVDRLKYVLEELRAKLSADSWHIFELVFIQEMPLPQVAEMKKLSMDGLYARISRIRRSAREI